MLSTLSITLSLAAICMSLIVNRYYYNLRRRITTQTNDENRRDYDATPHAWWRRRIGQVQIFWRYDARCITDRHGKAGKDGRENDGATDGG